MIITRIGLCLGLLSALLAAMPASAAETPPDAAKPIEPAKAAPVDAPAPAAPPPAAPAAPQRKKALEGPTLLVFDLVGEKNIEKGSMNLLTEVVMDRIAASKKYNVIGQKDLDKMLFWEQNKQLKGCSDTSCLVQIAGAMGAAYYVEGSIGSMGEQYIVTLKLIDASSVRIIERATEKIRRDEGVVLKAVEHMTDVIIGTKEKTAFKEDAPPPPAPAAVAKAGDVKPNAVAKTIEPPSAVPWTLVGKIAVFTGVGGAALGGVGTYLAMKAADDFKNAKDQASMQDAKDRNGTFNTVSVAGYAGGAALITAGALVWGLVDDTPAAKREQKVTLAPVIDGSSLGMSMQGRW